MRKLVGPGVPPKRHPRGPMRTHEVASGPPLPPKRHPRGPRRVLVELQCHPRGTQGGPQSAQEAPKRPLWGG